VNSKCKVGRCGPNADTKFFSQTQRRDVALFKEEFARPGPDKMRVSSKARDGEDWKVVQRAETITILATIDFVPWPLPGTFTGGW
jgi:hypothetical protein